jgi:hypothetical protein
MWAQIQKIGVLHITAVKAEELVKKETAWSEKEGLDLYIDIADKYFHGNLNLTARTLNGMSYAGALKTNQMFAWDELEFAQPIECKLSDIPDRVALRTYVDAGFPGHLITTHTAGNLAEAINRFPSLERSDYSRMSEPELVNVLLHFPDADISAVNQGLAVIAHNDALREYYRKGDVDMASLLQTVGGLDVTTAKIIAESFKRSTVWNIVKEGSHTFKVTVPELLRAETVEQVSVNARLLENTVGEIYKESQSVPAAEVVSTETVTMEKPPAQSLYEEVREAYDFNPAIAVLMTEMLLADNFDDVDRVISQYDVSIDEIVTATKKLARKVKRRLVRWSKYVDTLAKQRSASPNSGII